MLNALRLEKLVLVLSLSVFMPVYCYSAAPNYKIVNLRTIGPQVVTYTSWFGGEYTYTNNSSRGISINDSCVAVGVSSSPSGDRGFYYKNKALNSVGVINSSHTWSDAYDINNNGVIVGSSNGRAYILSNNVFTDIGDGRGRSINESGQITGDTFISGNQAFLYSGGVFQILTGASLSNGSRINESGLVVGETSRGGGYVTFKYFGGTLTELGSLAGSNGFGSANGVNDFGEIVGWTQDANAELRVKAFLIRTNGVMQNLGVIKSHTYSDAYDINNQGQVVGSLGGSNWTGEAGFLWQGGTMYDINDLVTDRDGWTVKRCNKINNLGWIVADGSKDGVGDRALLLIPDSANTSDFDGDGVSDAREFYDRTDINNATSYTASSVGLSVPATGDSEAPVLSLIGHNPLIIPRGSAFVDPGASVNDDTDEYRIVIGSGTVDTSTVGIYTVTYVAQDLAGNISAPLERSVFVYQPNNSLSIPTIPTSFPLAIKQRPTNVLALRAWYGSGGNSYNQGKIPQDLSNVVAISSGIGHNLALRGDGTVYAWGNNSHNQCSVPSGLSNVVSISAGGYQSIALKSDGTLAVWGFSTLVTQTPVLSNVVAISEGTAAGHVFALKSDGTVVTWGGYGNEYGQLSPPADLTNAVQVAAGCYHGAALRIDGTVVTWGGNNVGQQNIPAGLTNVVAISCSERGTIALKSDGTVVTWGDETFGGTMTLPTNLGSVARIKAGRFYNGLIQLDGTLVSFGSGAPASPNDLPPLLDVAYGSGWIIAAYEARDTNAPTISLLGANPQQVYLGSSFADPGATVNDNIDPVRTIYGTGTVNTATLGTYTLTYSASDSAYNSATSVDRTINVVLDPSGDQDGDGLTNGQENELGSNPLLADSNSDGINDGRAYSLGYSPTLNLLPLINSLKTNPVSGLYNQSQYDSNRTAGRNEILNSPNSYNLYSTSQIQNLGLGGIILNRNANNQLVLNYQILQSTDLQNWSSYQNNELVISNAPSDKMFLRVQAVQTKAVPSYPSPNSEGRSDSGSTGEGGAGDGGTTASGRGSGAD